ncbi:MAG: sigma-70 family RNA polymerase sigma factor, partial [Gammaproteobacteria bacterium]|nr:sigma-70 family RNA polymerase sigma factor [Gammaproteobacteria bacterium]
GFKHDSSFSTWLFRIAHNECMTQLRKLSREKGLFAAGNGAPEPIASLENADAAELGRDIERVLAKMSFVDREVLTLRFVSDLPLADIAKVLGIKLSAAKMRLSRASGRFAELLDVE